MPRDVRAALGLKPGDRVRYLVLDGGEVRILPLRSLSSLGGLLHDANRARVSLEDMDAAIAGAAQE